MARTIIVGYDGSDCAKAALAEASRIALDRDGSRIVVVTGHHIRYLRRNFTGFHPEPADTEDLKRRATAELRPLLDEACARISESGVPVEATLAWDHPSDALLTAARKEAADLIVIGAHGIDSIGRAIGSILLGSTASRLLHQSTVPVLVVPLPADAQDG